MSAPVLVTGGAGNLGRRVVAELRRTGRDVRVFDLPSLDYSGLEGVDGVRIVRGDITEADSMKEAMDGVSAVIHLAALLPPLAEKDRRRTFSVNVDATRRLAEALNRSAPRAPFVFSSSVSTYGDTSREDPPIGVGHPQKALDWYAESKIAAERALCEVCPRAVILRISGIAVPTFYEPPEIWPFMPNQRIEFVHRDDVVTALCAATESEEARGKEFIVAGGASWQVSGREYVSDYYGLLGVPIEDARFLDHPGYFDFYATTRSQNALKYQNTGYADYLAQIGDELQRLMGE